MSKLQDAYEPFEIEMEVLKYVYVYIFLKERP